eukprot:3862274-Pyramimonas_sp.AAC.1
MTWQDSFEKVWMKTLEQRQEPPRADAEVDETPKDGARRRRATGDAGGGGGGGGGRGAATPGKKTAGPEVKALADAKKTI